MTSRRVRVTALWLGWLLFAVVIVARSRYITDLSAFLPANPTPMQRLLVDQLRDGPASRLILIALEGGDEPARARLSTRVRQRLQGDHEFVTVANGAAPVTDSTREFLFQHRYLLSETVTAQRFCAAGLASALEDTVENLASPAGILLKSLVPHDPTGEMLQIIDQLGRTPEPAVHDGVWVAPDGARALLLAQTAAGGSDTDAQAHALQAIRDAFAVAREADLPAARAVQLRMSGPGVFAVAARAKIETAAIRLSTLSSALVITMLLAVYRSVPALVLGLLPVITGALTGIATVALGFGAVHGITLGFGITLIGESVDYSIYFFIQSLRNRPPAAAQPPWQSRLWPTVRLGMLTSVCGFASLLPSGFPGLAQLGVYSISGLIAAALVTRFVLPVLLPRRFMIHDLAPFGSRVARLLQPLRRMGGAALGGLALAIAAAALGVLYGHRDTLWNRELSALSPVSSAALAYDAQLRADLGAANVLDLVVVSGADLQSVLRGAERAGAALRPLIAAKVIADFESPANFLPSMATQAARRASLPDGIALRAQLTPAADSAGLKVEDLSPFLDDVEAARRGGLVTAQDLQGTSLAAGFNALIIHRADRWNALLPLRAVATTGEAQIDLAAVAAALASQAGDATVLDLKRESDAMYASYLRDALRLSLAGFGLIAVLLALALRSAARVGRVLAPLVLAVLTVAAILESSGQQLTLLHLVGMLLIVAVGSNYALFFDAQGRSEDAAGAHLTLASLVIANVSTVIGFGLLSFSQVPVLVALGTTVAPGACLALLFAAALSREADRARTDSSLGDTGMHRTRPA